VAFDQNRLGRDPAPLGEKGKQRSSRGGIMQITWGGGGGGIQKQREMIEKERLRGRPEWPVPKLHLLENASKNARRDLE